MAGVMTIDEADRYRLMHDAATDAGNRHARAAGRATWNADDYDAAADEFARLWGESNEDGAVH